MPPSYLFSEEGRSLRGSKPLLLAFTLLWLLVSCAFGYAVFAYYTKGNFTPLQRVYYPLYRRSAWRSYLPFKATSKYVVLERTVLDPGTKKPVELICTDREVAPVFGEDGLIARDPTGMPAMRLLPEYRAETKAFNWRAFVQYDRAMHDWFRRSFYEDRGFVEMLYPSLLGAGLLFLPGLAGAFFFERRLVRRRLRGRAVRGTRELTPRRYAREMRGADGVGVEVFAREVE